MKCYILYVKMTLCSMGPSGTAITISHRVMAIEWFQSLGHGMHHCIYLPYDSSVEAAGEVFTKGLSGRPTCQVCRQVCRVKRGFRAGVVMGGGN